MVRELAPLRRQLAEIQKALDQLRRAVLAFEKVLEEMAGQ